MDQIIHRDGDPQNNAIENLEVHRMADEGCPHHNHGESDFDPKSFNTELPYGTKFGEFTTQVPDVTVSGERAASGSVAPTTLRQQVSITAWVLRKLDADLAASNIRYISEVVRKVVSEHAIALEAALERSDDLSFAIGDGLMGCRTVREVSSAMQRIKRADVDKLLSVTMVPDFLATAKAAVADYLTAAEEERLNLISVIEEQANTIHDMRADIEDLRASREEEERRGENDTSTE